MTSARIDMNCRALSSGIASGVAVTSLSISHSLARSNFSSLFADLNGKSLLLLSVVEQLLALLQLVVQRVLSSKPLQEEMEFIHHHPSSLLQLDLLSASWLATTSVMTQFPIELSGLVPSFLPILLPLSLWDNSNN